MMGVSTQTSQFKIKLVHLIECIISILGSAISIIISWVRKLWLIVQRLFDPLRQKSHHQPLLW